MNKNKSFLAVAVGISVLVFAGSLFWANRSSNESSSKETKTDPALLIKPHSPVKGSDDAKVTIVEFLDPECEACRAMNPIIKRLMSEYEGKVRLVIRYMPLHGNSRFAALALEEAREQGKYDAALDVLFDRQPEWADHGQPKPELVPIFLEQVGVAIASLDNSSLASKHGWKIDLDHADGIKLGVRLTPTFFVNGEVLHEIGYGPVKRAIEKALSLK